MFDVRLVFIQLPVNCLMLLDELVVKTSDVQKEMFVVITYFAQLHVFDLKTLVKLLDATKCNDNNNNDNTDDDDDNNNNNNNV